jgi:hypothetical protein
MVKNSRLKQLIGLDCIIQVISAQCRESLKMSVARQEWFLQCMKRAGYRAVELGCMKLVISISNKDTRTIYRIRPSYALENFYRAVVLTNGLVIAAATIGLSRSARRVLKTHTSTLPIPCGPTVCLYHGNRPDTDAMRL